MLTININVEKIKNYLIGFAFIAAMVFIAALIVNIIIQVASAIGIVVALSIIALGAVFGFLGGYLYRHFKHYEE